MSFSLFLSSPQAGFLRFLRLLSSFDWRNNPLVVNLNKQLTGRFSLTQPPPRFSTAKQTPADLVLFTLPARFHILPTWADVSMSSWIVVHLSVTCSHRVHRDQERLHGLQRVSARHVYSNASRQKDVFVDQTGTQRAGQLKHNCSSSFNSFYERKWVRPGWILTMHLYILVIFTFFTVCNFFIRLF